MDEPFTGLDPVNVALLREAFLELRDRGKTIVFSTHQMEMAEAMCESVAIVDRGRVVVGGPLRDVKRSTGRRVVILGIEGHHRLRGSTRVTGARVLSRRHGPVEIELEPGVEPEAVLAAAVAAGACGSPISKSPTPRSSRSSSTTSAAPPTRRHWRPLSPAGGA